MLKREQFVVNAGEHVDAPESAESAMRRLDRFVDLCLKYRIDMVSSKGTEMVLEGRPRNVRRFRATFAMLSKAGLV